MVILSFLASVLWIAMLIGFIVAVFWVIATVVCTENSNTHVVMVKPAEDRI